jgi:nucleosome binding factor SPN SPT16 subunit
MEKLAEKLADEINKQLETEIAKLRVENEALKIDNEFLSEKAEKVTEVNRELSIRYTNLLLQTQADEDVKESLRETIKLGNKLITCVHCGIRSKNYLYEKCGHLCVCDKCEIEHKFENCPICNEKKDGTRIVLLL